MQWIFVAVLLCVNTAWSTLIVNDPINIPQAFVLCETGCYVAGFCCHSTWMILFLCLHREEEKYKWTIMGCNDDDDDGNYTWGSLTKFKHIQLGSTHFFGIGFWRAFQLPPPSIANFFFPNQSWLRTDCSNIGLFESALKPRSLSNMFGVHPYYNTMSPFLCIWAPPALW